MKQGWKERRRKGGHDETKIMNGARIWKKGNKIESEHNPDVRGLTASEGRNRLLALGLRWSDSPSSGWASL